MDQRVKENLKIARWIVTHPLHALFGLMFLAALEGAFGSPSGATRMLVIVIYALYVAVFGVLLVTAVWITASGFGVQLWIGLGVLVITVWAARHLRWQA